jgi:hypothetical protein
LEEEENVKPPVLRGRSGVGGRVDETDEERYGGEGASSDLDSEVLRGETVRQGCLDAESVGPIRLTQLQAGPCFQVGDGISDSGNVDVIG